MNTPRLTLDQLRELNNKGIRQHYDIIIGIDPDVDKNGICLLMTGSKSVTLHCFPFPETIEDVRLLHYDTLDIADHKTALRNFEMIVIVEAGWLNDKSNFRNSPGKSGERIAKNVGANHQVGKLILEMCRFYDIPCMEIAPLRKTWKGKDGKITHEEISYFIPDFPKQSNQETRDACLLAWNYANFPIKVKPH